MRSARAFLLRHPLLAAALLLTALVVRLAVPTGYMPVANGGTMTLQLCSGTMPAPAPMAGMHHGGGGKHEAPAQAEQPCAFAALGLPALASADPLLLAAALLFAVVLALRGTLFTLPHAPARLRPPLRAPPLSA